MAQEDKLYGEILDTMLLLRDVAYEFKCYSANDIKTLISSKMKAKREVKALKQLYQLEEAIGKLRFSFIEARAVRAVSLPNVTDLPEGQPPAPDSH